MKNLLSQNSLIGKSLCIVGLIAIALGIINLLIGCSDLASVSHYHRDIETMTASLRLIGAISSGIAGLLLLGFSEVIRCLSEIAASSNDSKDDSTLNLPSL